MAYDFDDLKTVSVANGAITLRIPTRWGVWPDEDRPDFWGCYEKEADGTEPDTGTLWIGIERFFWEGDSPPSPHHLDMRRMAEEMAENRSSDNRRLIESTFRDLENGCLWFRIDDTEENGEGLRFWTSNYFVNQGPHAAAITMNLVLTHAQMNEPEFVELREIMEREVASALLGPFRQEDEDAAEDVLGPLRLCNFDDWVRLTLPEAMSINVDETSNAANPRWYCRLTTEASYAGMFIELQQMEMKDEAGDPVTLPGTMYREVADSIIKEDGGERTRPMPDGIIAYEVAQDREGIGEADENGKVFRGYRTHTWRRIVFTPGAARRLTVLLMLPLPEYDQEPYAALSEFMDGAVRRATFPGFSEPENF